MMAERAVRVSIIELVGYREWTESLGDDREWLIQESQAQLYGSVQRAAAKLGAFVMPIRYDYMLILSSNVSEEAHKEILEVASSAAKVKARLASFCSKTPLDAEISAWRALRANRESTLIFQPCDLEEISIVGHLDVNDITQSTREEGITRTYHTMLNIVGRLSDLTEPQGGIVQYLGGDNVLVALPVDGYLSLVVKLMKEANMKVGLGMAASARRALALAARALHEIRVSGAKREALVAYINL